MVTSTVTAKNQITVPKEIREKLRLQRGDRVQFLLGKDGSYHMSKESPNNRSDGAARKRIRDSSAVLSLEQMDQIAREQARAGVRRRSGQ